MLVAIKDGTNLDDGTKKVSKSRIPLKDMKESHPIEVTEFAVATGVDNMPAFCWWVNHVLKKRDTIIASIKARVKKNTYKHGMKVPTGVDHIR